MLKRPSPLAMSASGAPMTTKTKVLIAVAILAIFDTVIPVPFTALIVIYALIQKPP